MKKSTLENIGEDTFILRSPEVQEIMGKVPTAVVRMGITVIFSAVIILLVLSWFIRYPDIITANVRITTTPPPVTLLSRVSGTLILLKKDGEHVQENDLVGYVQSNVSLSAVQFLEGRFDDPKVFLEIPLPASLGDLQFHYNQLISALIKLRAFKENQLYSLQIAQHEKQIATYYKLEKSLSKQQSIMTQELDLSKRKFLTDSILFEGKVTAAVDFGAAKISWLQQQRSTQNATASLLNNEVQINQLYQQVSDLKIKRIEELQQLELLVKQSLEELKAQLDHWKKAFVLVTPVAGTVAYMGFLENHQNVDIGTEVFSIMPNGIDLIAKAELPVRGSGKVKIGQRVNIRLDNYPFEQFGVVHGYISGISEMPGNDRYWITINLPEQLKTNHGMDLQFKQQLSGSTEIITEDLRLLERFIYQIRKTLQARGG